MEVYAIRHGQSTANARGIVNSSPLSQVHLTKEGKQQVARVAIQLKTIPITVIYHSQLVRTKQTASILNRHHKVPMYEERLINEITIGGEFEGKPIENYRKARNSSGKTHAEFKVADGESFIDVKHRVQGFLLDLKEEKNQSILLVTHEVVLQVLNALFGGKTDEEAFSEHIGNAVWTHYSI